MRNLVLCFGLITLFACSSSTPATDTSTAAPANGAADATNAPAAQCGSTEFVASGQCYPTAEAACAILACTTECIQQETAPVQVRCK